jgi:L-seryl-tRNA(Ser) seleniumtransferase
MPPRSRTLRGLPAVEILSRHPVLADAGLGIPRLVLLDSIRVELALERARLREGSAVVASADALAERVLRRATGAIRPHLRRVFNATGVVLHTNLGRAPLAEVARSAVAAVAAGYCSLEYEVASGRRGERGAGVERWLTRLTGAEAALAVNNGAAAVLLVLSALAAGRRVLVSRGELVEIGGSFRIPEILEKSGAVLLEVGTTNRTHLRDYERAFERHEAVGAILRVHPSNFRLQGFTARPGLEELAALARRRRVPLVEDLGSGALVDLVPFGIEHEPTVGESLAAGAGVVTCSGDKLLGGSQAGLVLGRRRWLEKVRKDPLARALRLDKLALAALEATLPLYADPARARREIPTLAMLGADAGALEERAWRLAHELGARVPGLATRVVPADGEVGGGALPLQKLPGFVVEVEHDVLDAHALEARARAGDPAVIGVIRAGHFRLDVRTLTESEVGMVATTLGRAWGPPTS